jgi:hypothetical protein
MLTGKNIDAINEFIARWNAGERGFTGRHEASERALAKGLRELGVEITSKMAAGDFRQKMSEIQKALWADPKHRAKRVKKMSATAKTVWADDGVRAERLAILHSPKNRKARSQRMKAMWAAAKAAQVQAAE